MGTEGPSTVRSCVEEYPCRVRARSSRPFCQIHPGSLGLFVLSGSFWFVLVRRWFVLVRSGSPVVRSGSFWFVGGSFWFWSGSGLVLAGSGWFGLVRGWVCVGACDEPQRTRTNQNEPERTTDEPERTRTNQNEPERTITNRIKQTKRAKTGEAEKTDPAWVFRYA